MKILKSKHIRRTALAVVIILAFVLYLERWKPQLRQHSINTYKGVSSTRKIDQTSSKLFQSHAQAPHPCTGKKPHLLVAIMSSKLNLIRRISLIQKTWAHTIPSNAKLRVYTGSASNSVSSTSSHPTRDYKAGNTANETQQNDLHLRKQIQLESHNLDNANIKVLELNVQDDQYPPLHKLRMVIESLRQDFGSDDCTISHVLLVDDDAYVRLGLWIDRALTRFPAEMALYAGQVLSYDASKMLNERASIHYVASGPGILLTYEAIRVLHRRLAPQSHGLWHEPCISFPHSDVTLGYCFRVAGIQPTHVDGVLSESPMWYTVSSRARRNHLVPPMLYPAAGVWPALLSLHRMPRDKDWWINLHSLFKKEAPSFNKSRMLSATWDILEHSFNLSAKARIRIVHDPH